METICFFLTSTILETVNNSNATQMNEKDMKLYFAKLLHRITNTPTSNMSVGAMY